MAHMLMRNAAEPVDDVMPGVNPRPVSPVHRFAVHNLMKQRRRERQKTILLSFGLISIGGLVVIWIVFHTLNARTLAQEHAET